MTLPKLLRMTADEFLAWAMEQEGRFELASGEVVAMAPERAAHARAKLAVARALGDAIRDGNLPCEAFTDGMAVRVDDATVHQPDASLRCGGPLDDDTVEFSDPVVLAEVLSPSTRARDAGAKLADYFRLPTVRHYLILRTDTRSAIHHVRGPDGVITTAIVAEGKLRLEPPGIAIALGAVFTGD